MENYKPSDFGAFPVREFDPNGDPVIDPFGLWNHMCLAFHHAPATEVALGTRLATLRALQNRYNVLYEASGAGKPGAICCGWRRRAADGTLSPTVQDNPYRCHRPLCPSCWGLKQIRCLETIKEHAPKYPVLYIRKTGLLSIEQEIHPDLWRQFIGYSSSYNLIAWTVAFEGDESEHTQYEHRHDAKPYADGCYRPKDELYPVKAKLIGMFGAAKPIRQRGPMKRTKTPRLRPKLYPGERDFIWGPPVKDTSVYSREGEHLTSLDRYEPYDTEDAIEHWLESITHPMLLAEHSSFMQAIVWSRQFMNTTYGVTHERVPK